MSKFEIITLVIIIIIICIILYSCQETFINNSVNLRLQYGFYGHKYFSDVTNTLNHNIYFLANKNLDDLEGANKNLYLMNHDMKIVKRPIPPPGYVPPQDGSQDKYSMSDEEIYNIAFLVEINDNNNNLMSFFKIKNVASIKNDIERVKLGGETFELKVNPKGDPIDILKDVYFIRNEPGNSNQGIKIVRNEDSENEYLEIDYDTIDKQGVGYSFKQGHQILEKYKHTFYLIPYICKSSPTEGAILHYKGASCLWHKRI